MAARTPLPAETIAALSIALPRVAGVHVLRDAPLARMSSLGVGGPVDLLAVVDNIEALAGAAALCNKVSCPWRVMWPFDSSVPRDGGAHGVVFHLGTGFVGMTTTDDGVTLGAATPFAALAAAGEDYAALASWPGTPGGLLAAGRGPMLAGPCASIVAWSGKSTRRRTFSPTSSPPRIARTTVPVSITFRPVPPAVPAPEPPGRLLAPDAPLAELGATPASIAAVLYDSAAAQVRLRGWRLSERWPGVAVRGDGATTADLLLLARGLADSLARDPGLSTHSLTQAWGRHPTEDDS